MSNPFAALGLPARPDLTDEQFFDAISGLAATSVGMIVAFVPSRQIDSIWRFELKMFSTCVVFLALAGGLFYYYSRSRRPEAALSTL